MAIHTNLDHVHTGVNRKISDKIGLKKTTILQPKTVTLSKLVAFVPKDNAGDVLHAMYKLVSGRLATIKTAVFRLKAPEHLCQTKS